MFDDVKKSPTTFGSRLRAARARVGLPQDQLGLDLGVSKSSVSAWERGAAAPSFALLPDLRSALRVSLDELICGDAASASGLPAPAHYVSEPLVPYQSGVAASSPSEAELLRRYRAMSKTRQSALLELIR